MNKNPLKFALLGNPNSGKTSVFNQLTGLRQKVGNFPGVTVDKKSGIAKIHEDLEIRIIDFPGTYSLYPTSEDERIVVNTFSNPEDENFPDAVIYVADLTNLERQLLLLTQIRDLGLPIILVLNMKDLADKAGITYQPLVLSELLDMPVVVVSGRSGENFTELRGKIAQLVHGLSHFKSVNQFYSLSNNEKKVAKAIMDVMHIDHPYRALLIAHHYKKLPFLTESQKATIQGIVTNIGFVDLRLQIRETMQRYDNFIPIARRGLNTNGRINSSLSDKIDNIAIHRFWGPLIFIVTMILVFQAIFSWSSYPMDWIESSFNFLGDVVRQTLPDNWISSLITEGILAGLGGIVIFVPQIAILFFLLTILEEVGYMARAVFIFDKVMQKFGLNGRSMVALVSSGACAIPAIMSTRTIGNWKERLITIMVSPLISCSARIPVYAVLIGFVVPSVTVWGVFNMQGLAFLGLYALGIIAALLMAIVFKLLIKTDESSYLMIELPDYRLPVWKSVFMNVWEKVWTFIKEAGKIILIISIVLWFLASFGPAEKMAQASENAITLAQEKGLGEAETANLIAAQKLENSYAGHLGKVIEPTIRPLGFDWKMGIAIITSFAAREVFVGTMATIYSIGSDGDEMKVRDQMAQEKDPVTGEPVYSFATALSLLIFYVFAMQCMSTLAVVKRETKSWKWPVIQFFYMSGLAYLASLVVYQLFS